MKHLLLLGILVALISACDSSHTTEGSAQLDRILQNTVDESIMPGFSAFKTEVESLATKADSFCAEVTEPNLLELQAQWKTLSSQWSRVVMYNIGPLDDDLFAPNMNFIESLRLRGTDYTNTVRAGVRDRLKDDIVLDADYFNGLNFQFVGLLALESLIFEHNVYDSGNHLLSTSTDIADVLGVYQLATGVRKCDYLKGVAQLLARTAIEVEHGWRVEYLATGKPFKTILLNNEAVDGKKSVVAIIIAIQEHLDYLQKRKLDRTEVVQIAGHFYENIAATLAEIELILEGKNADSFGFFDQMSANGFDSKVSSVRINLNAAKQAAAAENRSDLEAAIGRLDGNFKREVADGLKVSLGVNFADGD